MYDEFLAHYGIIGQKWGVRRFQPYSVRGRKGGKGGKEIGEAKKHSKSPTHEQLTKSTNAAEVYKYRDQLSDKELRDRVNRIQTEQQLKQLMDANNKKKDRGKNIASDVMKRIGTMAASAIAIAVYKKGESVVKEILSDPSYYLDPHGFYDAAKFFVSR